MTNNTGTKSKEEENRTITWTGREQRKLDKITLKQTMLTV